MKNIYAALAVIAVAAIVSPFFLASINLIVKSIA